MNTVLPILSDYNLPLLSVTFVSRSKSPPSVPSSSSRPVERSEQTPGQLPFYDCILTNELHSCSCNPFTYVSCIRDFQEELTIILLRTLIGLTKTQTVRISLHYSY